MYTLDLKSFIDFYSVMTPPYLNTRFKKNFLPEFFKSKKIIFVT